jgi:GT2 family glycosyltransferase
MNSAPLVFVIVLNYNGMEYLKTCLSSLELQTYTNYKIVVFDNASTDNSVEFVIKNFPNITLIQGEKNFGFAKGNNLAIKFALSQKADYVFLVNNDTFIKKDLIEKLINTVESDHSIGIAGPAVFDLKNKRSIQEMGMAIDRFGYPLAIKNSPKKDSCIFFVSGCAMMIKSELISKIGFFDEKYFMFAEDLDLCWRAQLAGYKITVNETARIYHASGASISGGVIKASSYKTNVKRVFLREKNTLRTLIKNYGTSNLTKVVPFYVALLLFESIFWSCILKPDTSKNIFKAIFWNIKFLPDTLQQRALVQKIRKIQDNVIVEKMMDGYGKLTIFRTIGVPHFVSSK